MIPKPQSGEYSEWYNRYLDLLPDTDICTILENQAENVIELLKNVPEEAGSFAYAPDKWSIKTLFGHIIDTERIMAYRALAFSRGENQSLPGFDENEYASNADSDSRSMESLLAEYSSLRKSNLQLFKSFNQEMQLKKGKANGREVSVRALIYIIAAHELHHINILKDNYLNKLSKINASY